MTIDELLRETAPDLDRSRARAAQLRGDVLARATSTRRPRSRRPLRAGLAAAAAATVGLTGVAYATGTVPAFVTSVVDQFGADAGVAPADRPEMVQFVDLAMPDGTRFAAWRGVSDGMWCTAYTDQWDGRSIGAGGAGCGDDGPQGYELNRVQVAWAHDTAADTHRGVVFGEAKPGEVEVRITGRFTGTGERADVVVPVDPTTGGFAAVLPGTNDHPWAYLEDAEATIREAGVTLEFLDASGAVTRTVDELYA